MALSEKKRGIRIQIRIIISALLLLLQLLFLFFILYDITAKSAALYVISTLAGTVTVIYIVNRRGNPSHKIAWIIFILVFPVFGISVYLLWGGGRVMPHKRKQMEKCESHYLPCLHDDSGERDRLKYYDMFHSRQADYLSGESGYPLYGHTETEYLSPGEKIFEKMLSELSKQCERQGIAFSWSERLSEKLCTEAKSRNEGARPIAKLIDKNVRNMISDGIISGEFSTGDGIYADIADDDSYSVRKIKSCTCYR